MIRKNGSAPFLFLAALLMVMIVLSACVGNTMSAPPEQAELSASEEQPAFELEPIEEEPVLPEAEPSVSWGYPVLFAGEETSARVWLFGTRPYIGNVAVSEFLGRDPVLSSDWMYPRYAFEGNEYISLADAARCYGLEVLFTDEETVCIWERKEPQWSAAEGLDQAEKPCYVRLEDIMADEGVNGRFTHENLQKLRVMASYLDAVTDGYYIAWIPLYVNPGRKMQNDISRDVSFYNADFVYTLDHMVAHGGSIGLHGLTHQMNDEISADGYEFGEKCNLTEEQVRRKFEDAMDIAARLGYPVAFWEFPHYDATKKQADLAAEYFDLIYQCHPDHKNDRVLDWRTYGERRVAFLPTPAGYVRSEHDKAGILGRLAKLSGDDVRSLYMHPSMDYRHISVRLDGKTAEPYYDAGGILPSAIAQLASEGYRFQTVQS